jgi:hypothetical protein
MILFSEDWLRYPDAIIDHTTRNKSALELAAKFRMMGVENNAFFLALHNPDLQGVDPFDPNLTQRQMLAIGLEIKVNPWYYFREIGRVPAMAGNETHFIEFNRANIAEWWCFFNHIITILTQPRQTGKSFCTDHLATVLMNFLCSNTTIHLLTKDDKLRAENIDRLKKIYNELPAYLNLKTREDANNTEEITVKRLSNAYKTHVAQADQKKANNQGRGMSTPILFNDEGPFQKNLDVSLMAAVGAMGAAIDAAKRNGEPYGIVFTTTAGRKDEKEGAYFYDMVTGSAPFSEKFYDAKNQDALEELVKKNGRGNYRVYICFSHTQLGKDDEWLREKITLVPMTPEAINRDFFNVWTSGNSSSPFPIEIIEKVAKSEREPVYTSIEKFGYMLRWYIDENKIEPFMQSNAVVAGLDTSDAVGKDDIAIVFTSIVSGEVIASGQFNETNLINFAMFLVDIMVRWPKLILVPERRSSAIAIIDHLLKFLPYHKVDPFKRIFNWVAHDPLQYKERAEEMQQPLSMRNEEVYTRSKRYFGFATSGSGATSRQELYTSTLLAAVKRNCTQIYDKMLGGQIRGLQVRNGRVDHAAGEHDDHVVAWLLTHWFLTKGENMSSYGIDPMQVFSRNAVELKPRSVEEKLGDYMQLQIRQRINNLFELMAAEANEFMFSRYEQELRQLDRQLVLKEGENFSIDRFLHELDEKKKKNRVMNYGSSSNAPYARQMGYSDGIVREKRLPPNTVVIR